MKKLLLLGALLSTVAMSANIVEDRGGFDFSSNLNNGFEVSGEYRVPVADGFEIGGGAAYRFNKINRYTATEVNGLHQVPIYFTARYNFKNFPEITPYVKTNLGFSINSGKIKYSNFDINGKPLYSHEVTFGSGLYYGVGSGIRYKNFTFDLSYNWINTDTKVKFDHEALNYGTEKYTSHNGAFTIGVGYTFGL